MKATKEHLQQGYSSRHQTTLTGLAATGVLLAVMSGLAQTTNVAELRELRVACLESFNNAKTRLDELHEFVEQQAGRERGAADELFQLKQTAASAKRRNGELQQHARECTNLLSRAERALQQSTASYRAAVESMPNGEAWAQDGSAALNELRRAADAAPRDTWKHKRVKEIEGEFIDTLREWRAARRSMERASFDLELRAAPSAYKNVASQIDAASGELKALEKQLAEYQASLNKLSNKSEEWGTAIRGLREGEYQSRQQLAKVAFDFHLVDLKFAAWRLKHSDLGEEGIEALPDVLEASLENPGEPVPESVTRIAPGGLASNAAAGVASTPAAAEKEASSAVEEGDAAFRELLARVTLAQGWLQFLSEVFQREFNSVEAAIGQLETVEDQARTLTDDSARLAADQEALRRSVEKEQQTLARGAETLDLVKKRFASDVKEIKQMLEAAAEKTAMLAKKLGQ
jgi:chromosome segregation ATPase